MLMLRDRKDLFSRNESHVQRSVPFIFCAIYYFVHQYRCTVNTVRIVQ